MVKHTKNWTIYEYTIINGKNWWKSTSIYSGENDQSCIYSREIRSFMMVWKLWKYYNGKTYKKVKNREDNITSRKINENK